MSYSAANSSGSDARYRSSFRVAGMNSKTPNFQVSTIRRRRSRRLRSRMWGSSRISKFAPTDAREVAGDQGEQDVAAGQAPQHRLDAGTVFVAEVRADAPVIALGGGEDFGHGGADEPGRGAGAAHHFLKDHGIEHALHGD